MEQELVKLCLDYLAYHKIFAFRNNTGAYITPNKHFIKFGYVGSGDIFGVLPDGKFLSIECKNKKNKTTPNQEIFIKRVNDNKGLAFVVRALEDLILKLKEYGYTIR